MTMKKKKILAQSRESYTKRCGDLTLCNAVTDEEPATLFI